MQKHFRSYYLLLFLIPFAFTACGNLQKNEAEEEHHHEEEAGHENNMVRINEEQFRKLDIQLGEVEERNLTGTLKTTGFLKVPPQNKAGVTSFMGGTVQTILVQEGDYVRKGQILITVVNPEFIKMQEEYSTTSGNLTMAKAELDRQKELSTVNISAKKTLQQAEADYNALVSKMSSLENQFSLMGIATENINAQHMQSVISVRSPLSGTVSHIDVNIGSSLTATDVIMDVVDNAQLHLDVFVFEQDLPSVKKGQHISFSLTNLPGKNYGATIYAIGSSFEDASRTIPVHAQITGDKSGLIEGMNITAFVEIKDVLSAVVPTAAIVSEDGRDYMFILPEDHPQEEGVWEFEKMPVKMGIAQGGYTEITPLGDYKKGDQVVVNGAFYLLSSLSNEGEAHEH